MLWWTVLLLHLTYIRDCVQSSLKPTAHSCIAVSLIYLQNVWNAPVQVQDMNLLHTLVAGCISYREFLEHRDMLVSC